MGGSAVLYQPSALKRLVSVTDHYAAEEPTRRFIQGYVPDNGRVLFVGSDDSLLYWIADREPVTKTLNINVQTTHHLRRHPDLLLSALDDPRLQLVEFNPLSQNYEDTHFLTYNENRTLIEEFLRRLIERFDPVNGNAALGDRQFWVPKIGQRYARLSTSESH